MSKKRKTRQEKILARQRSVHIHSQENTPVYSISSAAPSTAIYSAPPASIRSVHNYAYVTHDMLRTLTITSILVGVSSLFFILIQNHIIRIAFLGY